MVHRRLSDELLDYDPIYEGKSEWHILPAIDHPEEPSRTLISGTGLTHLGSARGRQMMHSTAGEELTDSMRMFRWGMEGGRPAPECVGIAPEWFYKGTGTILRAHSEPLDVPAYAEDGGEEAEIAGVYVIAGEGRPYRIGIRNGQRVLRPSLREEKLSQPGRLEVEDMFSGTGIDGRSGVSIGRS